MSQLVTPARFRQGFGLFVLISLLALATFVFAGSGAGGFVASLSQIQWRWIVVGLGLASLDWIGGGLRLWVLAREVHEKPSLRGMIIAGGMGSWGGWITPWNAGASPMIVYAMKRAGVPVPKAMTTTLMSFIGTVIFFGVTGPLAILLGAGKALGREGDFAGMSLLDLFKLSISIFAVLGVLLLAVMLAPKFVSSVIHRMATALGKRSKWVEVRLGELREGIDQAHESMTIFNTPRGWLALFWATILSGPSHANKLLAGYVALRAVGIHAQFFDILLLQTLITVVLYFGSVTPGGAGLAEGLSALVLSTYFPTGMSPIYLLVWRCITTYFTVAAGFVVFSTWVRQGLRSIEVPAP